MSGRPTHCQCLLLVLHETHDGSKELNQATRRSLRTNPYQLSIAKAFTFIPEVFISQHPELIAIFKQNDIHTVSRENVCRLFGADNLELIEILLEDNSQACVDPLTVVMDSIYEEVVRLIFSNTTVKRGYVKDIVIRSAIDDDSSEVFNHLLTDRASKFDSIFRSKTSVLHVATRTGHKGFVRVLLDHDANADCRDSYGSVPLHEAAYGGHAKVVKLFINRGAAVDATDEDGRTPLFKAINSNIVKILLQNGADPNAKSNQLRTPIFNAVELGCVKLVDTFLKYGAEALLIAENYESVLKCAFKRFHLPVFQYLLESVYLDPIRLKETGIHVILFRGCLGAYEPYSLFAKFCEVLGRHTIKIAALHRYNLVQYPINVYKANDRDMHWSQNGISYTARGFNRTCELEVERLKSTSPNKSEVSWFDILTKDESQVANLLRNNSVTSAIGNNDLKQRFPIYGSILKRHLLKGKFRKTLLEEGIKSFSFLSVFCKNLPYEMKENILRYLSNRDILILKEASKRS